MKHKQLGMLVAIYLATFMTAIEATIVVTAVKDITHSLGDPTAVPLIFSTYLFASAIATPVFSRFADQLGKKRIFECGLLLFLLGTLLAGSAQQMQVLLIARVIQGIGAGGIMPMTFSLIGELFDLETRSKVMGLNNSAWGIASLIAPLLGGLLINALSWHWIFFVNVPIGVAVLILVEVCYQNQKGLPIKHLPAQLWQHSLLALSLLLLLAGLQLIATQRLLGMTLLVVAVIALILFYRWQQHQVEPVLPMTALANGQFRLFLLLTFSINGALIGLQVYLPLWIQNELGLSPTLAGLGLLPSSIMFIVASYFAGTISRKFGVFPTITSLLALASGMYLLMGILPGSSHYLILVLISSVLGGAIGITVTLSVLRAQASGTATDLSTVSGFITLCRTLGQSFMITLLGLINAIFGLQAPLTGYHLSYLFLGLLCGALVARLISSGALSSKK